MAGIDVSGIEISKQQVEYAEKMLGKPFVCHVQKEHLIEKIKETKCNVVSAIGVLEHIYNLNEILEAISQNAHIEYLYFSIPLFSFSVFLEMVFKDDFNRQLGGGHTHLFTEESIEYMNKKFGFEVVGQWKFGADIMDLFRIVSVNIEKQGKSIREIFEKKI